MSNQWNRLPNKPPSIFTGKKERDLVKQITTELTERVIGEQILYFPIDIEHSNFHPLYGECINKTFLPPIRVYALINWDGSETKTENGTIDRRNSIVVHFHSRRLQEDQNIYVTVGDFVRYGDEFFEIVEINQPRLTFGQVEHKLEVEAKCIKSRSSYFNAE